MTHSVLLWFTVLAPVVGFALHYWLRRRDRNSMIFANSRQSSGEFAQMMQHQVVRGTWVADIMMVIVSLAVLGTALYIILSHSYDAGSQKWAFGAVGSIVGFWLRGRPNA